MKAMQKVILDRLDAAIESAGREAVQQAIYSNTGRVYAMRGLRSACSIMYDFQSDYCSLSSDELGGGTFRYDEGQKLEEFMQTVRDWIASGDHAHGGGQE